jgi:hypothetical protein
VLHFFDEAKMDPAMAIEGVATGIGVLLVVILAPSLHVNLSATAPREQYRIVAGSPPRGDVGACPVWAAFTGRGMTPSGWPDGPRRN